MRTIFPQENGEIFPADTVSTHETPFSEIEPGGQWVSFPSIIRNKKTNAEVVNYGKQKA